MTCGEETHKRVLAYWDWKQFATPLDWHARLQDVLWAGEWTGMLGQRFTWGEIKLNIDRHMEHMTAMNY